MRIQVLGTPTVVGDGDEASETVSGAVLGGRRAHIALVALALSPVTVSSERLAGMIWGEDAAPPTWPVALRGVIRGLRLALEPVGGGAQRIIVTEPGGYRIAPQVEVDLALAEQAIARAVELSLRGRYRAALDLALPVSRLSGAMLLADEDGAWLRPYRDLVDAVARQALDAVADAAGGAGDHLVAVAAARRRVEQDPLDEHAHRCLIRTLDRGGDRAGAVRAYEECRSALAEHLGVDPSAETVQVYLATLRDQPQSLLARVPVGVSSFVGREAELARLRTAVAAPGLVTVTGLGGVGKSRLTARAVSSLRSGGFAGGRLWVALGSVTEDALVAATVALSLAVAPGTDDATRALAAHLATLGPTLLVLDGAETARDGVASLVSGLVSQCPLLTVVVTSRLPLGLDGEAVLRIEPMPTPEDAESILENLENSSLTKLLMDRVRDGGGDLDLDPDSLPHVMALLRRCGGLPLAVELVAAQLAAIPAGDLLDQFDPTLADQTTSDHGDPLREIALSSYALLDEQEAAVFRRLAVLDGSVGLALVRGVVADEAVAPVRVVRILRELTASGLVGVDRSGPHWYYRQDDDLRRFAAEVLARHGEERAAFDRLADAVRAVLPEDAREPPAPYQATLTDMLPSVRSLFRAGIAGRADGGRCLELAFRLHRYWAATNVAEGRFWLTRLLAACPRSDWSMYANYALGYLDYWCGETADAIRELESVVAVLDGVDDPYKARALIYLAGLLDDVDRGPEAVDCVRRAIDAAEPFGTDLQVAAAMGLGSVLSERGEPEAARYAVAAIELCRSAGSAEQLVVALPTAAMVCWQVGAADQARAYLEEARPLHDGGRRIARVVMLSVAAGLALESGDLPAAVDFGLTADREGTDLGVEREMPLIRAVLARALLDTGDLAAAAVRAGSGIEAALGMSFDCTLAVGLETACLVLRAAGAGSAADLAALLAAADAIRRRGDRPQPAALAGRVDALRATLGAALPAALPAVAAGRLALDLLAGIGPH